MDQDSKFARHFSMSSLGGCVHDHSVPLLMTTNFNDKDGLFDLDRPRSNL